VSRTLLLLILAAVGLLFTGCAKEEPIQSAVRGVSALERLDEVLTVAEELLPTAKLFEVSGSTVETQSFSGLCTSWSYRFYSTESQQLLDITLSRDGLITANEPKPAPDDIFVASLESGSLNDSSTVLALLRDATASDIFQNASPLSESYHLDGIGLSWSVSLTASSESEQLMTLTAVVSLDGEILELREGNL